MSKDNRLANCAFGDLTPAYQIGGIRVYDSNSFVNFDCYVNVTEPPEQPALINADNLNLGCNGIFRNLGPGRVLTFHGNSTRRFWKQKFPPFRDVESVIAELESQSVNLEALSICNPGGYVVKTIDGVSRYNYFVGIVQMQALMLDSLIVNLQGPKLILRGERHE